MLLKLRLAWSFGGGPRGIKFCLSSLKSSVNTVILDVD